MQVQGFRLRVRISRLVNGTVAGALGPAANFVVARYMFDDGCEVLDVPNSEGIAGTIGEEPYVPAGPFNGYKDVVWGQAQASIDLEAATLITNAGANPFLGPFTMSSQFVYRVEVFPNRTFPRRHVFPRAVLASAQGEGQVAGLQPHSWKFRTDGPYQLYTAVEPLGIAAAAPAGSINPYSA